GAPTASALDDVFMDVLDCNADTSAQNPRTRAVAKYRIASDARSTPRPSHDAARRVRSAAASCADVATTTTATSASFSASAWPNAVDQNAPSRSAVHPI